MSVDLLSVLGGTAAIVVPLVGLQTFWIARSLDRIDRALERIEGTVLHEHGERITRLEGHAASSG